MPTYHAKHRLARSEPHPELGSGNSVPWERKYTAVCGYVGYVREKFLGSHRGVTCLRCLKKMPANKGLQADGATGWRKMDDGSMGDFDWSDITQEPPRS